MIQNIVLIDKIKQECKKIEEDALYSSKGHYNASDFWSKAHYGLGLPMVILSAWMGVDVFNYESQWAGYLAIIVATLASLQTMIKSSDKSLQHKNSGDEFNSLKNEVRRLGEIKTDVMEEKQLSDKLDLLADRYSQLTKASLQISEKSYKKAKEGIKSGQNDYKEDK